MKTKKTLLIVSSFLVSALSIILLYNTGLGINITFFTVIFIFVLLSISLVFKRFNSSLISNSFMLMLLGLTFSLSESMPVLIVSFLSWIYLAVTSIYSLYFKNSQFQFWRYITAPFEQFIVSIAGPFLSVSSIKLSKKPTLNVLLRVFIGFVIALPILIIFTILLLSADLAFKNITTNIFSTDFLLHIFKILLWFTGVLWFVFGSLYFNLFIRNKLKEQEIKSDKVEKSRFLIESVTVLFLVEVLFLVFNLVQITYLFGGENMISGENYTYSEYARKGFFELVAVSILAFLLLGFIFKIKKTKTKVEKAVISLVGLVGIFEILPMAASAFWRLYMYEKAYGFTRLRVYSQIFIIYLIVLYFWFGVKITTRLKEKTFLYVIVFITFLTIAAVGIFKIDGLIANLNIRKFYNEAFEHIDSSESINTSDWLRADSQDIDISYLNDLSTDAVLPMVDFYSKSEGEIKSELAFYLYKSYQHMKFDQQKRDIREFNFSYYLAKRELEKIKKELKEDSEDYEVTVVEKWKSFKSASGSYSYYNDKKCNGIDIYYLDTDGHENYYSEIEFFKYEKVVDESNYENIEFKKDVDKCYELPEGKYFFKVFDVMTFFGRNEIFIVEIDKNTEKIYLISEY